MTLKNKRLKTVASLLCVTVVCLTATFTFGIDAKSLNEYNETASTFDDFLEAEIDSDIEVQYGVSQYTQTTSFKKSGDTAVIDTNAYVEWSTRSDVAFLYKRYEVAGTGNENKMTFETSITARSDMSGGSDVFSTGSGGLLLTDSVTDPTAPRIYLHYREGKVTLVYRSEKGNGMGVIYGSNTKMPIQLKIVKSSKKYTCSYKGADMSAYATLGTVTSNFTGPLYAGVASHSSDKLRTIHTAYKGWYAVGQGAYDESAEGDDSGTVKNPYPDTGYIDPPYDESTALLYESFSKGIRLDGEESVSQPKWLKAHTELVNTLDNGNRVWYIAQEDGSSYLGDEYWTDYTAECELSFTKEMQAQDDDAFIFWVRNRSVGNAGYFGYGIAFTTNATVDPDAGTVTYVTKMSVVKQFAQQAAAYNSTSSSVIVPNMIGDGIIHKLKVYALDNKLMVYLDGELLIEYTDSSNNGRANLRGGIGFYTKSVDVTVDNILVNKLEDELGGDFDNYIGDNFDEDMPEYVKEFYQEHGIRYFNGDEQVAVPK